MTVPGGVISLPQGASTEETLAFNLQNMSGAAMKSRAIDRFPDIMNGSTGGNPAADLSPLGILTSIWAGTNSLIANADPADIQGPEDLPGLLLDFIEGLPVVGQLVGLVEAILGNYDGDDQVLLTIQGIFAPIRTFMQLITGQSDGFPTPEKVIAGFGNLLGLDKLHDFLNNLFNGNAIEGNQFPPYNVPFTPGAGSSMSDAQRFIANLKAFLSFDFLAIDFNPADAVSHFIETVMGIPDLIRQAFTNLVNLLVGVLDTIPFIGPPLGNALEDLAAMFGLIKARTDTAQGTGEVAQGSADTANVGVAILNARVNDIVTGGASFYDTFGRDLADFSTDPDYDVAVAGGSGNPFLTTANEGRLRWNAVGFSDTSFVARQKTTAMASNRVRVSVVIDDFTYGFAGNQAHVWLMARMDATRQNYVIGVIEDGAAEIGYVKAGVYTRIGAQESVNTSTGDLWDLEVSNGTDEWRFRLLQNNSVRVDRTDLGHLSMKDATPGTTYKYLGIGGDCAIGAGPFGTTYQIGMPDFQVIAGGDF